MINDENCKNARDLILCSPDCHLPDATKIEGCWICPFASTEEKERIHNNLMKLKGKIL